jgi:hypothetical protein
MKSTEDTKVAATTPSKLGVVAEEVEGNETVVNEVNSDDEIDADESVSEVKMESISHAEDEGDADTEVALHCGDEENTQTNLVEVEEGDQNFIEQIETVEQSPSEINEEEEEEEAVEEKAEMSRLTSVSRPSRAYDSDDDDDYDDDFEMKITSSIELNSPQNKIEFETTEDISLRVSSSSVNDGSQNENIQVIEVSDDISSCDNINDPPADKISETNELKESEEASNAVDMIESTRSPAEPNTDVSTTITADKSANPFDDSDDDENVQDTSAQSSAAMQSNQESSNVETGNKSTNPFDDSDDEKDSPPPKPKAPPRPVSTKPQLPPKPVKPTKPPRPTSMKM